MSTRDLVKMLNGLGVFMTIFGAIMTWLHTKSLKQINNRNVFMGLVVSALQFSLIIFTILRAGRCRLYDR